MTNAMMTIRLGVADPPATSLGTIDVPIDDTDLAPAHVRSRRQERGDAVISRARLTAPHSRRPCSMQQPLAPTTAPLGARARACASPPFFPLRRRRALFNCTHGSPLSLRTARESRPVVARHFARDFRRFYSRSYETNHARVCEER